MLLPANWWCFKGFGWSDKPIKISIDDNYPYFCWVILGPSGKGEWHSKTLQEKGMDITARELSILAVATTILQQRGIDPFSETIIIQVDNTSVVSLAFV